MSTELRCPFCKTLNRVTSFSVRKMPWCGNCGKPLPEPGLIRILRVSHRYPRALLFLCLACFLSWVGRESIIDTLSMSLSCPAQQEPAAGIYARYSKLPRPVELNFDAPGGANYLVRLVDAQTETPVISYFIRG